MSIIPIIINTLHLFLFLYLLSIWRFSQIMFEGSCAGKTSKSYSSSNSLKPFFSVIFYSLTYSLVELGSKLNTFCLTICLWYIGYPNIVWDVSNSFRHLSYPSWVLKVTNAATGVLYISVFFSTNLFIFFSISWIYSAFYSKIAYARFLSKWMISAWE